MSSLVFNVKDKSLHTWLQENALNPPNNNRGMGEVSCYHLLQDEILIKNNNQILAGTEVVIELEDFTMQSRKQLLSTYTYEANCYDSVSMKLTLVDFKVELHKNKNQ